MKRLTIYLFFAAIICTFLSFVSISNNTKKEIVNTEGSKFFYLRVATLEKGYYFSNIIEVVDEGSNVYNEVQKQKLRFKKQLKSTYDLDWPLTNITSYEWTTKERAIEDRKTRIKQAGDDVKYIDL